MSAEDESQPKDPGADAGRRGFFRAFSRDAAQTAVAVIGVANALQRDATTATTQLLGLGADPATAAGRLAGVPEAAEAAHRPPYRLEPGVVAILDQRRLPAAAMEIRCLSGEHVAAAIREQAVRGGPLLGVLAGYAMALAARQGAPLAPYQRYLLLRGTADALIDARPDVAAIAVAVNRAVAAWQVIREPADGSEIATVVRAVADAIAAETDIAVGRLVGAGAAHIAQPDGRPLEVITIDATGPLSGGRSGTAMGVLLAMAAAGRPVHAWVCETRPSLAGARLAAAELTARGVPCTVIADGAAGWVLRERPVDAVIVGADRIAANGDVAAATGTYPLAVLAAHHAVPFYVCAPLMAVDDTVPDHSGLAVAMRPAAELLLAAGDPPPARTDALVPLSDVTPAGLVRAWITDAGVVQSPFAAGLPAPTG